MTILEPELITIVEGPPPDFQLTRDFWPFSQWEGQVPQTVALTQMRTFNGLSMMERCTRAWGESRPVLLDFPEMDGLRRKVEVLAARVTRVEEGDVLHLWVALPTDEVIAAQRNSAGDDDEDDGLNASF